MPERASAFQGMPANVAAHNQIRNQLQNFGIGGVVDEDDDDDDSDFNDPKPPRQYGTPMKTRSVTRAESQR